MVEFFPVDLMVGEGEMTHVHKRFTDEQVKVLFHPKTEVLDLTSTTIVQQNVDKHRDCN